MFVAISINEIWLAAVLINSLPAHRSKHAAPYYNHEVTMLNVAVKNTLNTQGEKTLIMKGSHRFPVSLSVWSRDFAKKSQFTDDW